MPQLAVVERLYVIEEIGNDLRLRLVANPINSLVLQIVIEGWASSACENRVFLQLR